MINHCMFICYFGYLKISKTHAHDQIHSFPSQKNVSPSDSFLNEQHRYPSSCVN